MHDACGELCNCDEVMYVREVYDDAVVMNDCVYDVLLRGACLLCCKCMLNAICVYVLC